MSTALITRVGARVAWILGAQNAASFTFALDDDRFTKEEIANAIVETEAELVHDFAEAYHPQRIGLAWSANLATGDTIPAHIGQVEAVRIQKSGSWVIGESTSRTNIREWNANPKIFPNSAGYFNNTNETLEFTGTSAQVKIVTYVPHYNTLANSGTVDAVLQIDSQWEGLLAVGAVPRLARIGVPSGLIDACISQYNAGRAAIRQGLSYQPNIEAAQITQ